MSWRPTVAARLLLTLCAIAAFSTGLALLLQERSLSADLQRAARERLDRASAAAERLLASHLQATAERYGAISGAPQFRANLEANHAPTLRYYAQRLAAQQRAPLVLFLDRNGRIRAFSGDETLAEAASRQAAGPRTDRCDLLHAAERPSFPELNLHFELLASLGLPGYRDCPYVGSRGEQAALFAHAGIPYTLVSVALMRGQRLLGHLVALEPMPPELLAEWSALCGARVEIAPPREPAPDRFAASVRALGGLELRVTASLRAERDALAHSRRSLLTAGLVALALAFAASVGLAKGLVRPLRAVQRATERIAGGELATRLDFGRRDEFGDVARAFNVMLDRLQETQTRLASAQRLARLGNWAVDGDTGEVHCSAEFRRIYELEADEERVTVELLVTRIHPDDRDDFRQAVEDCVREGKPFRLDHRVLCHDGSERILHSQAEPVLDAGEAGAGYVEGTVQDVTERKLVEEQVRYLAYHDSLTGLGNRRLLKERLGLALHEAQREERILGVMFLDIDDFKTINDTLGHSAGDQLLVQVADRLVSCVHAASKSDDPASATVARLGGDEFTVMLGDLGEPGDVASVAERILEAIALPFDVKGHEVVISGSIGITTWPADGCDVEALLRNSDTAMYHAKRQGRNRYQFYTEAMKEAVFKRLRLENKLRRAIERREFQIHYQPKVQIDQGRIIGVEALVRWRDPEAGMVLPGEFIPLAEETGFILAIGEWVLRQAVEQAVRWREQGLPPIHVSVNLSAHQIEDPAFADSVAKILEETGLDPTALELEITESALMRDQDAAIELLQRLKDLGIQLSLDDFGTGYSSLSMLRRLPVDTLKIDRSFVGRITHDEDDAALVGAIVSMAKVLRMRVVVEGVETESQRELLQELGCDEIQGFLFSSPVPPDEVVRMLRGDPGAGTEKRKARRAPAKSGQRTRHRRRRKPPADPKA